MAAINRFVSVLVFSGLFFLGSGHLGATTYYVSTSGNDSRNGRSEAMAWRTIGKGVQTAVAGDIVYVKAGLYSETAGVSFRNSGTASLPIVLEGYKISPGDRPTYPGYVPGASLDSTQLPVLQGQDAVPTGSKSGISIDNKNYITVRNLGVAGYYCGVTISGSQYDTLNNVFVVNTYIGVSPYQCNSFTLTNSVVADAEMHNISLREAHYSTIENCNSYAVAYNPVEKATDYHICLADGHNSTVRNCVADNRHSYQKVNGNFAHPSHGIGIKDVERNGVYSSPHSYGNTFNNCIARNCGENFYVSHAAYNNEFVNCKAYGDWKRQDPWSQGINIRDGAHDNIFRNCRMEGLRASLNFQETSEGPATQQYCNGNAVYNCVFTNSNVGIELWNADNNTIRNCVFNNCGEGTSGVLLKFPYTRINTGNTCRNTIVSNCPGTYRLGTSSIPFTYSDFYGNRFVMPSGTGNLDQDPLYADVANKDFHLKSTGGRWNPATSSWVIDTVTSPCIDAGDPADAYSLEPVINGRRINIGAYGNTTEASKTGRASVRPPVRTPSVPSRAR